MSKSLPVRPSLEQLKKQAKDLLKFHQSGAPDGLRRIQKNHPHWYKRPVEELRATRFSLGAAQLVIAREYGCASWPKLKARVESILAEHRGGFGAFCFEVTTNLSATGTKLLAVRVNNAPEPDLAPLSGDFSVYGGLYRPARCI